ncbi:MAG: hypothetical protein WD032_08755 [Nitrospirales bacterium]
MQQGYSVQPESAATIAESLRPSLGECTCGVLRDHVEEIFVVED